MRKQKSCVTILFKPKKTAVTFSYKHSPKCYSSYTTAKRSIAAVNSHSLTILSHVSLSHAIRFKTQLVKLPRKRVFCPEAFPTSETLLLQNADTRDSLNEC